MTVSELIDELTNFVQIDPSNGDLPVGVQDQEDGSFGPHEPITCELFASEYVEIGW